MAFLNASLDDKEAELGTLEGSEDKMLRRLNEEWKGSLSSANELRQCVAI